MDDKQSYHHENLRAQLIEAGIRIMNEQGYEQLSMRRLASACGVSHAAPYRHFADREALLRAMQAHVEQQFAQVLQKAVEQGEGARYPMVPFGRAYVVFFVEHPAYYTFFTRQDGIWVNIAEGQQIDSNYLPFLVFKEQATRHLGAMKVPAAQQGVAMAHMWALVHGLAGMATMSSVHFDGDWGDLTEKILMEA